MLLIIQKFLFDPHMVNQGDVNLGTFRDDPQISLLTLGKFKRINWLLIDPLKSKSLWFSGDFKWKRRQLVRLICILLEAKFGDDPLINNIDLSNFLFFHQNFLMYHFFYFSNSRTAKVLDCRSPNVSASLCYFLQLMFSKYVSVFLNWPLFGPSTFFIMDK